MNMLKNVYTNLRIAEEGSLPTNPQRGQVAFVGGQLLIYSTLEGLPAWVPLTNPRTSYLHNQVTPASEWIVEHALESDHLMFSAYDGNGDLMVVNNEIIDNMSFKFTFITPQSGYCMVFSDSHLQGLSNSIVDHLDARIDALKIVRNETVDANGDTVILYDLTT